MKTVKQISILLLVTALFSSCILNGTYGNGNVITLDRPAPDDFNAIRASSGLNVYITSGEQPSIKVETDENLQEFIYTKIESGELAVGIKGSVAKSTKLNVYISVQNLNRIKATSGADVFTERVIRTQNLDLECTSGADIRADVMADELAVKSTSVAGIRLTGKVHNFKAKATSGSSIRAFELYADFAEAEATSGSDIFVKANTKLEAKANSGAEIRYTGNPELVMRTSSLGSVKFGN